MDFLPGDYWRIFYSNFILLCFTLNFNVQTVTIFMRLIYPHFGKRATGVFMNRFRAVLKYLAILIICTSFGCLGGYFLVSARNNPDSTQWQLMPAPPEPAVRIIELGGSGRKSHSITIETASGNQYDCCGPWPTTWNAVEIKKTRYGSECNKPESTLYNQLSGKIVDCAYITQFEWATEHYYAALLEDGMLWRWQYYYGLDTVLNGVVWGIVIGLGMGIAVIIYKRLTSTRN
jgi:hypothetical protein